MLTDGRSHWYTVSSPMSLRLRWAKSKATSSLFPIKMIAKLEWTQRNAQENIDQFQNPTME